MKRFISLCICFFLLICSSHAQKPLRGTIAVDAFKLQPVSTTTQTYVQQYIGQDLRSLGESFAALFTDKLRKAGYTVVTRKNIDTLLQENQLGQSGIAVDDSAPKLRSAEYRIIGTIRQFEESEKSNGTIAIVGAALGTKVRQAQAIVEVIIELIGRDGTVLATSTGKANKDGRMTTISGVGAVANNKVFGLLTENSKDFKSNAMTGASSSALDNAIKELTTQIKQAQIDESNIATSPIPAGRNNINLGKLRTMVAFPDSLVAEEVFNNALGDANARVIPLGLSFNRNMTLSSDAIADYCRNLAKSPGSPRLFIYGLIDSDRVTVLGQNSVRVTVSVRAVKLAPYEIIYSDSTQAATIDISNKAGFDRVVKEAAASLINKAMLKISTGIDRIERDSTEDATYSLALSGFNSLSASNRFLAQVKQSAGVIKTEVIDFSADTLFAEITVDSIISDLAAFLENDKSLAGKFSIKVTSKSDKKITAVVGQKLSQ